jgi:hypothetical protein
MEDYEVITWCDESAMLVRGHGHPHETLRKIMDFEFGDADYSSEELWMRKTPDSTGEFSYLLNVAAPNSRGAFPVTVLS